MLKQVDKGTAPLNTLELWIGGTKIIDSAGAIVTVPTTFATMKLTTPVLTPGTGTGVTVNDAGSLRTQVYKVTITYEAFTAASVTQNIIIGALPAKSVVHSVFAYVGTPFVCASVCTTATLSATLGIATTGVEFLESFDVDAAAAWFGDADGEVGTALDVAGNTNGGYISVAGTNIVLTGTSGTGNWGNGAGTSYLNAGSVTLYVLYTLLP